MSLREPREQLILDILQDGWDNTNTYGLTPKISFGWFDSDQGTPQVTIMQPDEGPTGGGNTGYSGFNGQTGQPVQTITGSSDVHLWAKFDELSSASTSNPRQYLTACADEVRRIVRNNADNPLNPSSGARPVWSLAPAAGAPVPEPDSRGLYHYLQPVQYVYDSDR